MNLSRKLPLSFALALVLAVGAGCGGLFFLGHSLDTFKSVVLARVDDERAAAAVTTHFKTQVQEWKDLLLRGSDAKLLEKHWTAFQNEEKAVSDGATALLARQSDPAAAQLLTQFVAAHRLMAKGYREGYEKFQNAGLDASVGDMAVRGIDREPAKLLVEAGRQIAESSTAIAAKAYADGQRAEAWGMGLMGVALLAGLGLGLALSRSVVGPLRRATEVAAEVAGGDLSRVFDTSGKDETAVLLQALAAMQTQLRELVGGVRHNAESVATASAEIAQGNQDLSQRTEAQASALQQTAATMEQLGTTVRRSAESVRLANELSRSASTAAGHGGEVVGRVTQTMQAINASSRRIEDITSVIDGIAFQTNILALNAAVEAARAGEQGRGFAVVASEVRNLAQRSSAAAKEIKVLISNSVEHVEQGSGLVGQAGLAMEEIVGSIRRVGDIIADIGAAADIQSAGVAQVGTAVDQMDRATQQNAALVEQSAAASESLTQQARQLVAAVAVFRTHASA